MDADVFWQIVEQARATVDDTSDAEDVAGRLTDGLAGMPPEQIVEFGAFVDRLRDESYRWDLWAAAYALNDGCSDDGFDYFRGWLIAQGRTVWDAALADPDSLADLVDVLDPVFCEEMLVAAPTAYARATGGRALPPTRDRGPGEPRGEEFDFDDQDEMRRRLPRLAGATPEDDDGEDRSARGFWSRWRRKH